MNKMTRGLNTNNPEDQARFCIPSLIKFEKDTAKYGTGSIFPRCDLCGEEYLHYYVEDGVWPDDLNGWLCKECLECTINRKIDKEDIATLWGNLFEVNKSIRTLAKILKRTDIDFSGKSESDYLLALVARVYSAKAARIVRKTVKFEIKPMGSGEGE